jgi:hypothetical protein
VRRHEWFLAPLLAALVLACAATVATAAKAANPPAAKTVVPTGVGATSAVLRGVVTNAGSQKTAYWFELGTTTAYGTATQSVTTDTNGMQAQSTVNGLTPGTTYHVRMVARNDDGVSLGADIAFTTSDTGLPTPNAPAPLPDGDESGSGDGDTKEPAPAPAAPPSLGESFAVQPTKGTVKVRVPGASAPTTLPAAASVPVGSVVDTRAGAITLSTALPGNRTQTATFHGGLFEVRQPADARGMVELVLRGPAPVCPKAGASARVAATSAKRPPRQLWARDDHGRFRTRGSNSVATVRGTVWYVADRCDGTLTRVSRGSVSVRDLHTNRTTIVRAGHSYLARGAR